MAIFNLRLQETYFKQGFFNVIVDFDRYAVSYTHLTLPTSDLV